MANYKYNQLAEWIRSCIRSGTFNAGDKLPTELELANQFSISRDTVRQGFARLQEEGLITSIKGSGSYVAAQNTVFQIPIRNNTSNRIAVIMNSIDNYIFPSIIRGISTVIGTKGYTLSVHFTSNRVSSEKDTLTSILSGDYAGLIIEPTKAALPQVNKDLYKRIEKEIPTLFIHAEIPDLNIESVCVDDAGSAFLLTEHMIEHGHTSIGILCKFDEQTGTNRYTGYVSAMRKYGLPVIEENIGWFPSEQISTLFGDNISAAITSMLERCSAIICHDDQLAGELLKYLAKSGRKVPDDISVAGFDDSDLAASLQLTTAAHPKERFGRRAARNLVQMLENPSGSISYQYLFKPELIIRNSVKHLQQNDVKEPESDSTSGNQ